jgi:FAD/FMN-containing dehydrogenase
MILDLGENPMTTLQSMLIDVDQTVDGSAVAAFASQLRGELILPGDAAYDSARQVWNGMIDRRPALIARCVSTEDVIAAVNFARTHDLLVAVRGGGHQVAGHGTCNGGLVIDLSPMKAISVDPDARTARAQGGVIWGELDRATQAYGLATPGGAVSDTGIAGLTLGGGLGWLRNKYGLSCDNLLSVEVVTADGRLLEASATENSDLFWGIRGGGGNFGIVTSFEYQLHPVGPEVMFAFVLYHGDRAKDALRFCREYTSTMPDEVSLLTVLGVVPPGSEAFPEEIHGTPFILLAACYAGPAEEGERILQPLRQFDTPLVDFSDRMPYVQVQTIFDEDYPAHKLRYYWKSIQLPELSDEMIDQIVDHARRQPSLLSTTDLWHNAGAIRRIGEDETAYSGRQIPFLLNVEANWQDPQDDEANLAWVRNFIETMRPFSDGGTYLNFSGFQEEGETMMKASYGAKYGRLAALKRKYDPQNLFSLNPNIKAEV